MIEEAKIIIKELNERIVKERELKSKVITATDYNRCLEKIEKLREVIRILSNEFL